ncbi:hypothetical protein MNBD_GAMMA08-1041 [hydrothermal vent metagenome]|uniref:OmpA-like domain-containing protein n=1 Tax=hydrothermal vent metagenome TaxID=652676 RepID=A0A3B0XIW4_9ZZZZ
MNIENKINHSLLLAVSLPLLILGGCAANESVKLSSETDFSTEQESSILNEQPTEIDELISVTPIEESINVVEPPEVADDASIEIMLVDNVKIKEPTPKPQKLIIGFSFDEANIDATYGEVLWQHAQYLKENENLILNISGHTDRSGARVYNEMLSQKRAEQVAKILMDFGALESQIKVTANASDQPLMGAIHNRQHRRVELDFQDPQIVSN